MAGVAVKGATVVLRETTANVEFSAVTTERGEFVFGELAPGTYDRKSNRGWKKLENCDASADRWRVRSQQRY